jgi:hypothetical protein
MAEQLTVGPALGRKKQKIHRSTSLSSGLRSAWLLSLSGMLESTPLIIQQTIVIAKWHVQVGPPGLVPGRAIRRAAIFLQTCAASSWQHAAPSCPSWLSPDDPSPPSHHLAGFRSTTCTETASPRAALRVGPGWSALEAGPCAISEGSGSRCEGGDLCSPGVQSGRRVGGLAGTATSRLPRR